MLTETALWYFKSDQLDEEPCAMAIDLRAVQESGTSRQPVAARSAHGYLICCVVLCSSPVSQDPASGTKSHVDVVRTVTVVPRLRGVGTC